MTTLLSMTVSASVVIAVIIVIRSLFVHRLPKPVLRMLMEDISGKPQITTTQS